MSLKLNERYPGRFDNPSADYPQGSFKNRTSPTAKDGSYLEKDWVNDKEGFFQSLIAVAGITPSGTADKVGASQYYDALLSVLYSAARKTPVLTDTGTAGIYAAANTPALTALPSTGYMQRVKISNLNPGASTYSPDGLAAKPIYGLGLQPLQGGELPVGVAVLMYLVQAGVNGGNGAWIIIASLGGALQVAPATKSQHAVNLGVFTGANQSLATPGYQRLPGGFIRQFGYVSGFSGYTITLPFAFPNGVLGQPIACCVGGTAVAISAAAFAETSPVVSNSFKIFIYAPAGGGGSVNQLRAVAWECIGY